MVFLDDDGQGAAAPDAEASARADLLTADQTARLAMEFDGLASLVVAKGIEFGQSRAGFLQAMASHWDTKGRTFKMLQISAVSLVENRKKARAARDEAAASAAALASPQSSNPCPIPGCTVQQTHQHHGEGGPYDPAAAPAKCQADPESCPCDEHVTARISARNVADVRAGRGKNEEQS